VGCKAFVPCCCRLLSARRRQDAQPCRICFQCSLPAQRASQPVGPGTSFQCTHPLTRARPSSAGRTLPGHPVAERTETRERQGLSQHVPIEEEARLFSGRRADAVSNFVTGIITSHLFRLKRVVSPRRSDQQTDQPHQMCVAEDAPAILWGMA
jgi:hypothetical protein